MKRITIIILALLALLIQPVLVAAQSGGPFQMLVHVVQHGETLFSIARRYGTSQEAITHANGIPDPRQIYAGQQLLIPSEIEPVETWSAHVVQPGETLTAIAAKHGLPWHTLAMANKLANPHLLYAGQVLQLPAPSDVSGALHSVQPGETLFEIAFKYDVGIWELMEANNITSSMLTLPGQWLLIPGRQPSWMPLPFAEVNIWPLPVHPGNSVLVTVHTTEPVTMTGTMLDRGLSFVEEDGVYHAMAGVHTFTEPGLYEMTLTASGSAGEQVAMSVGVAVETNWQSYERIDVRADQTNLLDPGLVAAERERIAQVLGTVTPVRRWLGPFGQPVNAAISSYFGTRRSYAGGPYNSYHAGTDFNIGRGASVYAPADGVVVLAEPLAVRGNALVLDHGWGVLSGYWHLSSFEVAVGQEVQAGDVIARVGNTGLSTGAHLHWEMMVGGISVDGRQWLASSYPWGYLDGAP